jgi:hypothetical protein
MPIYLSVMSKKLFAVTGSKAKAKFVQLGIQWHLSFQKLVVIRRTPSSFLPNLVVTFCQVCEPAIQVSCRLSLNLMASQTS